MEKDVKIKRLLIDNKTTVIKVDVMIGEAVYVERDEEKKLINFYFPKDGPNGIYGLGVAMPMDLLDAYVSKKVGQQVKGVAKEMVEDIKLPDVDIG
jgi:hypothetical protein